MCLVDYCYAAILYEIIINKIDTLDVRRVECKLSRTKPAKHHGK